jgi:hypothetical protein
MLPQKLQKRSFPQYEKQFVAVLTFTRWEEGVEKSSIANFLVRVTLSKRKRENVWHEKNPLKTGLIELKEFQIDWNISESAIDLK